MLFSYVVKEDGGLAPNPFWGVCTLVVCKPVVRLQAQEGDWVVGTGSAESPVGDLAGRVVYAMQVTRKMPMWDYDAWARAELPEKIPDLHSKDPRRQAGDAIYDFDEEPPRLRDGWHGEENRRGDLRGTYALLSDHFYYFGRHPLNLPPHLRAIIKNGPGHKSKSIASYEKPLVEWLEGLPLERSVVHAHPAKWHIPTQSVSIGRKPNKL